MTRTLNKVHHHVFASILVVGIALFFGLIVYPKIAYERGEEGAPGAPGNITAEARGTEIIVSWEEPRDSGLSGINSYTLYYNFSGRGEEYVDVIRDTTYTLSDLAAGEYSVYVAAVNDQGEGAASDTVTVTIEEVGGGDPVELSGVPTVTPGSNSATITWGTTVAASSQVYYGPLDNLYGETEEYNAVTMVTTHEVVLSNLIPCAQYWYKALSYDADRNLAESGGGEFKTRGCKGDSEIVVVDTRKVTTSAGATITASSGSRSIEVVAPAALKSGVPEIAVTAMKLERDSVASEISAPSGKQFAGDQVYSLKALEDASTEVEGFDHDVSVTIDYVAADVEGLDLNSLKIYHYTDGIGWEVLSDCQNSFNGSTGAITCTTTSFSIFGLFGEEESGTTHGSAPSKPKPVAVETTPTVVPVSVVTEVSVEEDKPSVNNSAITKNLSYGLIDAEVKMLQKALNGLGFTLAADGAGAPGQETEYFGPRTRAALMKFQEVYKNEILVPLGIMNPTGFFGENTRAKLNALISS